MPTYEWECPCCHNKEDVIRSINDRNNLYTCWKCGCEMQRRVSAPLGRVKNEAYFRKHDTINRATAELAGIPYKDLPPGLRTEVKDEAA